MGTYLATGIVQDIAIDKRRIKYPDIKVDHIILQLKDELNLDCYNYSENVDGYYWKIKPEMLGGNLAEFLDTQFTMYQNKKDSDMQEAIEKIKAANTSNQVMEIAKDKLINFQLIDQIIEYIRIIRDNGFDEHIIVFYSLIAYFMDGKIITEGCGGSLRYFEHNIRLQRNKYPIVDCVKVMITS